MTLSFKRVLKFFHRSFGFCPKPLPDQGSLEPEVNDQTSYKTSYKRSFNRFPIEFEVLVSLIDSDVHQDHERSELHDVSGGGALFISQMPEKYYPGQLLKLDIFLAGTQDVRACIKTEASVVRIHPMARRDDESDEPTGLRTGIAVKFHQPFEFERMDHSFFPGNLT